MRTPTGKFGYRRLEDDIHQVDYHTDPKITHKHIVIDVSIPSHWTSASYHNDVCPSFYCGMLQIFVMDQATKELEELDAKYVVMWADDYGGDYDPILSSDDWDAVLQFVEENHLGVAMNNAIDLVANELMAACEEMHKSDKDMQEKIDTAWRLILNNLRYKGEK